MEIRFERVSLYEEVWNTPLTTLGKKYGLSDNGIRKVCKAMNIPLPKGGHWAKVAAGKRVHRPPLPEYAERTEFISDPSGFKQPQADAEDNKWLEDRLAFEEASENSIQVRIPPTKWHRVMVPIISRLKDSSKELEAWRRSEAKPDVSLRPRVRMPSYWDDYVHGAEILAADAKSAPLKVSVIAWQRAAAIMNACLFSAEERGFKTEMKDGRITLSIRGHSVYVRLAEQVVEDLRAPKSKGLFARIPKRATGVLRIHVGSGWHNERRIEEKRAVPLESMLNDVFKVTYRKIVNERAQEREWQADRKKEEELERRRLAEESVRRAVAGQKAKEQDRRRELTAEAHAWRESAVIQRYVQHVEQLLPIMGPGESSRMRAWLAWASIVAADMDPTSKRIHEEGRD